MKPAHCLLCLAIIVGMSSGAQAEILSPAFADPEIQAGSPASADPSFNSSVERGLANLTQLQCSMLSLMLLNPSPCAMP